MDLGLAGRVAVVTGASRGIGRAVAAALAAEGARVLMVARGEQDLAGAVEEVTAAADARAGDGQAVGLALDVSDPGAGAAMAEAAQRRWGRLDIVVNNAGGGPEGRDRLSDFDPVVWDEVFRRNVTAPVGVALACAEPMVAAGWGRIVNISSIQARDADPRFASYGAAKAALLHCTRTLAQHLGSQGVLVNAVLPGLTRTDGVRRGYEAAAAATGRTPAQVEKRMLELAPIALGRPGEPAEVADVVTFLCSERASWITGALWLVDGGTIRVLP